MYRVCQRLMVFALLVFAQQALAANDVRGNAEGVYWKSTAYALEGWACAYGISEPVTLHVYVGAPWPNGTILTGGKADIAAEPAVQAACGSASNQHRFRIPLSQSMLKQHAGKPLYVYAILEAHGVNNLVPGSGNIAMPAMPYNGQVRGNAEGVYLFSDGYYLQGWTCAYGINQAVEINVYAGGPRGSGALIHTGLANASSEPAVGSLCNTTLGLHRFSVRLSDSVLAQHQGKTLYVYAILSAYDVNDQVPNMPTVPTVQVVAAPAFSPNGGTHSTPVSVTIASVTSGASLYYTLNGSAPACGGGALYTGPFQLASSVTVKSIACKSGMTPSATSSASFSFVAAPPRFTPSGGTYSSAVSVQLSTATPGATIYYTRDGTTPACGSPSLAYSAPFTVDTTTTVRAISCRSGFSSSTPASATYTLSTANWSGPAATIITVNGSKRIAVNGQALGPLSFAFNLQANCDPDCSKADAAIDAQLAALARTQAFGTRPVIEAALGYRGAPAVQRLADRLNAARNAYPGFDPYVIIRFDLFDSLTENGGCASSENYTSATYVPLYNNQGQRYDANALCAAAALVKKPLKRFTEQWIAWSEAEISHVANLLEGNADLRGRVIGLQFTYMAGGEFFSEPYHASGLDNSPEKPWDPQYASRFYYPDYSSSPGLSVNERMNENFGIFLAGNTKAPSIQASRDEVSRVVSTLSRLAARVKQATGGRALTKVFYGYSYGLQARRAAAAHHGLSTLLNDPNIDIVASPYSYQLARKLGFGFNPQLSVGSVAMKGKLFQYEDDTRTHLKVGGGQTTNLSETNRMLMRDGLTAAMQGAGLYYFDLGAAGWFGTPGNDTETSSIWSTLKNTSTVASAVATSGNAYAPQIAVFVDEKSVAAYPIDGLGGAQAHEFGHAIGMGQVEDLTRIGAPVRHYLLSDLASLDVTRIRLAVFPDAYKLSALDRARIKQQLASGGRTLLFLYAPGLIDDNDDAADSNISSLLGMPVVRRAAAATFAASSFVDGWVYPDDGEGTPVFLGSIGMQYRIDVGGAGAAPCTASMPVNCIDSRMSSAYVNSTDVAFAVKRVSDAYGSYNVAYSAVPRVPTPMLRELALDAGVHLFSCAATGGCVDAVVEASDNTLMLHTVGALPSLRMPLSKNGCSFSVSEWVGMTTSSSPSLVPVPCSGNQCQVNVNESNAVRVYQLTPAC